MEKLRANVDVGNQKFKLVIKMGYVLFEKIYLWFYGNASLRSIIINVRSKRLRKVRKRKIPLGPK